MRDTVTPGAYAGDITVTSMEGDQLPTLKDCTTPRKAEEYVRALGGLGGWDLLWLDELNFKLTAGKPADQLGPMCFSTRELAQDAGQRASFARALRERKVNPNVALTAAAKDHRRRLAKGKQVPEVQVPDQPHRIAPLPDWLNLRPREWQWTYHALQRTHKRGIGVFEVLAAIDQPDFGPKPSPGGEQNDTRLVVYRGSVKVVYRPVNQLIITVVDRNTEDGDCIEDPDYVSERRPLKPTPSQALAYGVSLEEYTPTETADTAPDPGGAVVAVLMPPTPPPPAIFMPPPEPPMPTPPTATAPVTLELGSTRLAALKAFLDTLAPGDEFRPDDMIGWLANHLPHVNGKSVNSLMATEGQNLGLIKRIAHGHYRKPYTNNPEDESMRTVDVSLPWGVPPGARRAATDYPTQWYLTQLRPGDRFSPDDMIKAIETRRNEPGRGGRGYGSPDMGAAARSGTIQRLRRPYAEQEFGVRYIEEGTFERLRAPVGEDPAPEIALPGLAGRQTTAPVAPSPAAMAAIPPSTFPVPPKAEQISMRARFDRFIGGQPAGWKFSTEDFMDHAGMSPDQKPLAIWYLSGWSRGEGAPLAPPSAANRWATAAGPVTITYPTPAAVAYHEPMAAVETAPAPAGLEWDTPTPAPAPVDGGELEFVEEPPPPPRSLEELVTEVALTSGAAGFVAVLRGRPGEWAGLPGTRFTADLEGLEFRVVRPDKGIERVKEYRVEVRWADEHTKP